MSPGGRAAHRRRRLLITHVITSLEPGGAEVMLYRLLRATAHDRYQFNVITLTRSGRLSRQIEALGIPIDSLALSPGVPDVRALPRLVRLLRRHRPALVHAWMIHAGLAAGLSARFVPGTPIVWGLHQGPFDPIGKRSTRWLTRLGSRLAARPSTRIICCAVSTLNLHAALGYPTDRMTVIANGVDPDEFQPDPLARASVRRELGVDDNARLVGMSARFDPQKDHSTFFRAAGMLARRLSDVYFVLFGQGVTSTNRALIDEARAQGVADRCFLLGDREDVPRLTAALDVAALTSSFGEACPLAILEAMACAVPVVTTDVGDSARLVGNTGRIIPVRAYEALSDAWSELLTLPPASRFERGAAARSRVCQAFTLQRTVDEYVAVYESVLKCPSSPRSSKSTTE